ncbi:MAG TPA: MobB family relaxase [Arenibacter sp.]|nr:MobB family relaxase [Arenibacter sp.]
MYITITKQQMGETYSPGVSDFVEYLEKENLDKEPDEQEFFFDQHNDRISPERVIKEIDGNTAKLRKQEPKFYSLTVNPSQRELKHIGNDPKYLKEYVREVMKDYAAAFYRDKPVSVDQIKYFAKLEHDRRFKGFDREVKENQEYKNKIFVLENKLRKVEKGELLGNSNVLQKQIEELKAGIPHRINGEVIAQGMKKPGLQTHVHIIVSRRDVTNTYSLSPGSKYMESETKLNGKTVKRGFRRDQFFESAEKSFDSAFEYKRNFVESYHARKTFTKDPKVYFAHLLGLPTNERSAAFKLMAQAGIPIPKLNIPTNQVDLALKVIKQFKRAMDLARSSSSIGI